MDTGHGYSSRVKVSGVKSMNDLLADARVASNRVDRAIRDIGPHIYNTDDERVRLRTALAETENVRLAIERLLKRL